MDTPPRTLAPLIVFAVCASAGLLVGVLIGFAYAAGELPRDQAAIIRQFAVLGAVAGTTAGVVAAFLRLVAPRERRDIDSVVLAVVLLIVAAVAFLRAVGM